MREVRLERVESRDRQVSIKEIEKKKKNKQIIF